MPDHSAAAPAAIAALAPAGAALRARALHQPLAAPARIEAALALAGLPGIAPQDGRPPRVLLLGLGAGETALLLAATGSEVTGLDPHGPAVEAAQALLAAAGLPGRALQAGPADWPRLGAALGGPFDLVAMEEGWGRMPPAARDAVAALIGAHLRPGGAFLLVHPVAPGALDEAPFRQMCRAAWAATDPAAPREARAREALDRLEALAPAFHLMMRAHPRYPRLIAALRAMPPLLAAERWFEAEFLAEPVSALGARLRPAGIGALSPADPARLAAALDFTEEQRALCASGLHPADPAEAAFLAAELADLAARRSWRADLLLRRAVAAPDPALAGGVALMRSGPVEALLARPMVGFLGPHVAAPEVFAPILEAFPGAFPDAGPMRLDEAAVRCGRELAALIAPVAALVGQGALVPAPLAPFPGAAEAAAAANAALDRYAVGPWRAAPRLGCAVALGPAALAARLAGAGGAQAPDSPGPAGLAGAPGPRGGADHAAVGGGEDLRWLAAIGALSP